MFVVCYKQSFVTDVVLNSSQTKNTVIIHRVKDIGIYAFILYVLV